MVLILSTLTMMNSRVGKVPWEQEGEVGGTLVVAEGEGEGEVVIMREDRAMGIVWALCQDLEPSVKILVWVR